MPLFSKKSIDEERLEYIKYLKGFTSICDLLVSYAEKTEFLDKMTYLADEVRYLLPIDKPSIREIDKKIFNCLGDLKILLYTNRDSYRSNGKISELEQLIDERNTKI